VVSSQPEAKSSRGLGAGDRPGVETSGRPAFSSAGGGGEQLWCGRFGQEKD